MGSEAAEAGLERIAGEMSRTADHRAIAAVYDGAQQRCPVQRMTMPDGSAYWAVIGDKELDSVLKDHATFSSAIIHFGDMPAIPIEMDPPQHTDYRRVLNRVINPAMAKTLEADIRRYVIELLEPFIAAGGGDIMPVAKSLPMRVLCRLIGVDEDDWPRLEETQKALVPSDMVLTGPEAAAMRMRALMPVIEYANELIAKRRAEPKEDVVSGLIAGVVDGRPMSDGEIVQVLILLLLAGHETTGSALAGSVLLLSSYPEEQEKLRQDPSRIPTAVEEFLRVEAPVQALDRRATRDVELAGQQICAGENIFTVYGAANVDPTGFPDPATFDPARTPNRHFTFGKGIHTCVGAPIARSELKVFMEELLARTTSFAIDGAFERNQWPDLSLSKLHITLTAK